MKEKVKVQHVQVPDPDPAKKMKPTDRLVYAHLRSYMNKDTFECFPSLQTLASKSDLSINTIQRSINNLISLGLIEKITGGKGKSNKYKFPKLENDFERFTPEFLSHKDTTPNEKAYLIGLQSQCYKNGQYAMTTYSNRELAENLNMSEASVQRYNSSLKSKEIMLELQTCKHDDEGFNKIVKAIDMARVGQKVLFEIAVNHEDRLQQLEKLLEVVLKENKELKKQLQLPKQWSLE